MRTYTSKEIQLMFDIKPNIPTQFPFLSEPKDYFHKFGIINYKNSAVKKISEHLGVFPKDITIHEKPKPTKSIKPKKNIPKEIQELIDYNKRVKKIKVLRSLLIIPKVQRLNFKN